MQSVYPGEGASAVSAPRLGRSPVMSVHPGEGASAVRVPVILTAHSTQSFRYDVMSVI